MRFKDKITVQIVICMMAFAGIQGIGMIDNERINSAENCIAEHFYRNYSAENIRDIIDKLPALWGTVHETVTAAVTDVNKITETTEALGVKDENGMQVVYSVSGGTVAGAGLSAEDGLYVKIQNNDDLITYGNMSDITMVPGERVRKGDIIGTFDSGREETFLFSVKEGNK